MHTESIAGFAAALDRPVAGAEEFQLIREAIAGDLQAARSIYDAHAAAVLSLASRIVGPDGAADVTQDVFVRAFERLHQFRGESALRTWLHRITLSVALNACRREGRDRFVDLDADTPVASAERDPILARRLHREIDALPDALRSVFVLYVIEGYGHADIATIVDIAEGTSKARLSRARANLRAALADLLAPGM